MTVLDQVTIIDFLLGPDYTGVEIFGPLYFGLETLTDFAFGERALCIQSNWIVQNMKTRFVSLLNFATNCPDRLKQTCLTGFFSLYSGIICSLLN